MVIITELMKKLADYGVNFDETMKRFLYDDDFYESCLKAFPDDRSVKDITEALSKCDYRDAFEAAHALKGVTANLGLAPLSKAASVLVEALRTESYDGLDEKYEKMMCEYNKLLAIIC